MTTAKSEQLIEPTTLPEEPTQLQDPKIAQEVRKALDSIKGVDPDVFTRIFGLSGQDQKHNVDERVTGRIGGSLAFAKDVLVSNEILFKDHSDTYRSRYLVTPWHGMFYLTDFPDSGNLDEVFSPHVETKFFTSLLQVRPDDEVVDLCSGGGILLLDAVRRGARGTGFDISSRAVAFARANAALNNLQELAKFYEGDVTTPNAFETWGSPDVVISNPPFEPIPDDPGFPRRPRHSDGGPFGTEVVNSILANVVRWTHKPSVIQFALFALGRSQKNDGSHVDVIDELTKVARSKDAALDVRELLRPIHIDDYRVLNFGCGRRSSEKWSNRLKREGYQNLHLVFVNFFPMRTQEAGLMPSFRWTPHDQSGRGSECFLWPLASSKSNNLSRGESSEAGISTKYVNALIEARESAVAGREVDLSLSHERVRKYIKRMIRDESLFNGNIPLVLVDIGSSVDESPIRGTVTLTSNSDDALFQQFSIERLEPHIHELLGGNVGVTACDVIDPISPIAEGQRLLGENRFLKWYVDTGPLAEIFEDVIHLPKGVIQRFVVFNKEDFSLSPLRQRFFGNLLSELAGVAEAVRWRRVFESYSVAHPLKHRLGALGSSARRIREEYSKGHSIDSRIVSHEQLVNQVYCFAELSHLLHFALTEGPATTLAAESDGFSKFASTESLDLTRLIREVAAQCKPATTSSNQMLSTRSISFDATIEPFTNVGPGKNVRLNDNLYREVFYEIFGNALKHGYGEMSDGKRTVLLDIDYELINQLPAVIVSNRVLTEKLEQRIDAGEWAEWKALSPTGLTFVTNALRIVGAGQIFYKSEAEADMGFSRFSVALAFKGVTSWQSNTTRD